jgi:hypothetical protein
MTNIKAGSAIQFRQFNAEVLAAILTGARPPDRPPMRSKDGRSKRSIMKTIKPSYNLCPSHLSVCPFLFLFFVSLATAEYSSTWRTFCPGTLDRNFDVENERSEKPKQVRSLCLLRAQNLKRSSSRAVQGLLVKIVNSYKWETEITERDVGKKERRRQK